MDFYEIYIDIPAKNTIENVMDYTGNCIGFTGSYNSVMEDLWSYWNNAYFVMVLMDIETGP